MPATLFTGITQLVQPLESEGSSDAPLQVIDNAALRVEAGIITAAGAAADIDADGADVIDLGGRAVVPGLVDSHTHIVFCGDRIDEMARRARGETYEQIAAAGGGIVNSVAMLRDASGSELVDNAGRILADMLARGTTTCEIKTGYGLEPELELKQLRAIGALAAATPVSVLATALAHVVPPLQRGNRAGFVEQFCDEFLQPAVKDGAVRFCDVFIEQGAYTPEEARVIIARAQQYGLGIKLHVDQLRDGDGANLAAEVGALSADHLEYTSHGGRRALAERGVIATVLPGCRLFLGKGPWPPARELRDDGCEVAIATDCNPGSSMVADLPLCATLAATQCGLTLEEALWGITRGGAKALGLDDRGRLVPNERADFVVVDHRDWRALLYRPASPPVHQIYIAGKRHGRNRSQD